MFKGYNIVLVPRLNSNLERTRVNIWKANGASVFYRLNELKNTNNTLRTILIINDPKSLTTGNFKLATVNSITGESLFRINDYPVLTIDWLTMSLAQKRILPVDDFRFKLKKSMLNAVSRTRKKHKLDESENTDTTTLSKQDKKVANLIRLLTSKKHSHTSPSSDTNEQLPTNLKIIQIFENIIELYESLQLYDGTITFKIKQYNIALGVIEQLNQPIETVQDYGFKPNNNIYKHIVEILETGTFQKYELLKKQVEKDPRLKLIGKFNKIHGFSNKSSFRLIEAGITEVEDIEKYTDLYNSLNKQQKEGIKYYNDWKERIPRDECDLHKQFMFEECKKLDPDLKIKMMGSYARDAKDCGDIDFLIYKENLDDQSKISKLLHELCQHLIRIGYIESELTDVTTTIHKFNGGCRLKKDSDYKCRRIDIIAVKHCELGASNIYFIGNNIFNRTIRLLAVYEHCHLNNKGLFKGDEKTLIESFDERKIFQELGVEWVDYQDRNI